MLLSDLIDLIKKGNSNFIGANIYEDLNIEDAASLDKAHNHQISFLEENNILKEKLDQSKASAIITSNNNEIVTTLKKLKISNIIVKNPRIAFAEVLNFLYKTINYEPGIHSSAYVAKTAKIGVDSHIGHNVYIGENTIIGNNNIILPGSSILGNVQIGDNNIIHPNCVIYENTTLKNNCVINSNTVIGSEGFGFIPKDGKWVKMPQKGGVKIMSFVEIGTNCCVDRPSVGFTYIDEGTKLDNLVQIGHGVKIGKNCAFAAQVGIAGGAIIGDGVILAGQVGVNNRVKVGNNVVASSKCGIHCDIEDGKVISGFPAMNNKSWLKSSSIFKKLPELAKKLRQLDNQ